jgi:hypothetical protein
MKNRSVTKTRLGYVICVAGILTMSTGTALAGEITGNGRSLKNDDGTLNGKSECAWSGREDELGDPLLKGVIAQSWGQLTAGWKAICGQPSGEQKDEDASVSYCSSLTGSSIIPRIVQFPTSAFRRHLVLRLRTTLRRAGAASTTSLGMPSPGAVR